MKYWDEYQTKWGFNDGGSTPPDAEACRTVYIREINKLAKKKGSEVRLVAYDRPGMHNGLLITCVPAELVAKVPPNRLCDGSWPIPRDAFDTDTDDAMDAAIEQAIEDDVDSLVETTVVVSKRRR